jgi:uncharacterized protein with HEPN domain
MYLPRQSNCEGRPGVLGHILESIRRIRENTSEGKDAFLASHTLQGAELRNLQTMSESTQRLSDDLKTAHPEIEWYRIAAFRNVLVHDYLGIDVETIWEIVQRDVPELAGSVHKMLDELP